MRLILLPLLFLLIFACSPQLKDCSKFRTGIFKYVNEDPNEVIIIRTDSTQTEVNKKYNTKVISSVKWLSPCKCIITPMEFINYPYSPKSKPIKVEITETKKNSYRCIASDDSTRFNIEIIKIE